MKQWSAKETPKKSNVFTSKNVAKFCICAPNNNQYLSFKAIVVCGFFGLLRNNENVKLEFDDIDDHKNDGIIIRIKERKNGKKNQNFKIPEFSPCYDYSQLHFIFTK